MPALWPPQINYSVRVCGTGAMVSRSEQFYQDLPGCLSDAFRNYATERLPAQ
jgi:hypothetical protein